MLRSGPYASDLCRALDSKSAAGHDPVAPPTANMHSSATLDRGPHDVGLTAGPGLPDSAVITPTDKADSILLFATDSSPTSAPT